MQNESVAEAGPVVFPCSQCGGSLTFAPGTTSLRCPHCGHQEAIAAGGTPIVEYDLSEGISRTQKTRELAVGGADIQCEGCGAKAVVTRQSDHCAFCGSPRIVLRPDTLELIAPESLLPFAIDDRAAAAAFRGWVASRWLAPNDLKRRARAQGMDGVYLPYWTYDSNTTTRYHGQRGDHYWETEHYKDSEGRSQTRQVQKTRWSSASGTVFVRFDDVLVCASGTLPRKLMQSLEPWDLHGLHPFAPQYLSGFVTERYSVDLEQGFHLAEEQMAPEIDRVIGRDIGGDVQRISSKHVTHRGTTFKHVLLPLWISSFRYGDAVFRVVVNARTGVVAGERPWSRGKIAALVVLGILLIAVIVYLVVRSQ